MDARITSVEERILGSALIADTSIGAGTITVADATEFDLMGSLQLGSEIMDYTDADEETGIITLVGTLASTHTSEDLVYIYPLSQERVAYLVAGDDPMDEEGMAARIPHALWDKIPVGIRDWNNDEGETVQAEFVSDELVITELVGQDPVIDGSFIDPVTIPPNPSDGNPPASSPAPTITPGIGVLFVTFTPIVNADNVQYEVHVSVTTGFTPSGTDPGTGTCYAVIEGGFCTIKTDPATASPLIYDTPYFVKIRARDVDGTATESSQGTGTPVKANSPDLAVGSVIAETIAAGAVVAGSLEAELVLASTIETAASGRRVEISPEGISLFAADESTLVNIPTDTLKDVSFAGQIDANALAVGPGSASITGANGLQIEPDSQLHLVGGQSNPSLAPVVSGAYPSGVTLATNAASGTPFGLRVSQYTASGGSGGSTACYYGTIDYLDGSGSTWSCYAVEWLASTGAVNRSHSIVVGTSSAGKRTGFGAVRIGSHIYALFYREDTAFYQTRTFASTDFSVEATNNLGAVSATLDPDNTRNVALGTDGTNPFVFSTDSTGGAYRTNRASINISTPTAPTLGSATMFSAGAFKFNNFGHADNFGASWGPSVVTGAAWDGTNWYVQFRWNSSGSALGAMLQKYVQSTGATVAKQEIYIPDTLHGGAHMTAGIVFESPDYNIFNSPFSLPINRRTIKTAFTWDYTLGSILYEGYTWDDGTYHTAVSPIGQLSLASGISQAPLMGMTVTVTMPTIPALVTKNLLYALFASSSPAANTLKLQAATTYASTDTASTVTHKQFNASGAVNPDSNGNIFPAGGAPSFIVGDATGATASWKLDSSGLLVLPRYTTDQRPGSPAAAMTQYDEDLDTVVSYGGLLNKWVPTASQMEVAPRGYEYYSDLLGVYDDTGAVDKWGDVVPFANNGGTAVSLTGVALHPGIVQINTGGTNNATGNAGIRIGTIASNPIILGNGPVHATCLLRVPGSISGSPFFYIDFGVKDTAQTEPTVGFNFRWNNNVNSNKWQRGIAGSYTDTGFTAVVGSTWYLLDILVSSDATSAEFFINGTSVGTSSGSAQTGSAAQVCVHTRKDTSTATGKASLVDYIGVRGEFTGARF